MDNPQEIKKALLAALVEKGDYKSVIKYLADEEKGSKENEKTEKLTKLITPISAFADILTENSKGAFMEDLEARLDETTAKGLKELSDAIVEQRRVLESELRDLMDATKAEAIEEHLARYQEAERTLTDKMMQLAVEVASAKADEIFPQLASEAKLTEDEVNAIIDSAALSVESQITDIIGEYIGEYGVSVDQVRGLSEAIQSALPPERQVTWGEIVGKPDLSQGGTSAYLVKRMIDEALAGFSGSSTFLDLTDTPSSYSGQAGKAVVVNGTADGLEFVPLSGGGDMLAAVYDPANGARQVAFDDSVVKLTGDQTASGVKTFGGRVQTPTLRATSSAGLIVQSNSGTQVVDFGAGGGSNATFAGGVNIDGATRLATSLTGPLRADSGVVSVGTDNAGITRSVVVTSGSVTAGNTALTDYVYMVAGAHTISLPAASGNTNLYTIKNNHSANITVDTVGAETIDGTASISLAPEESVQIISNGTNYFIV